MRALRPRLYRGQGGVIPRLGLGYTAPCGRLAHTACHLARVFALAVVSMCRGLTAWRPRMRRAQGSMWRGCHAPCPRLCRGPGEVLPRALRFRASCGEDAASIWRGFASHLARICLSPGEVVTRPGVDRARHILARRRPRSKRDVGLVNSLVSMIILSNCDGVWRGFAAPLGAPNAKWRGSTAGFARGGGKARSEPACCAKRHLPKRGPTSPHGANAHIARRVEAQKKPGSQGLVGAGARLLGGLRGRRRTSCGRRLFLPSGGRCSRSGWGPGAA